jgi:hypothetical protein
LTKASPTELEAFVHNERAAKHLSEKWMAGKLFPREKVALPTPRRTRRGPHGTLDVAFGEDDNRRHQDHATENLANLRRLTISLLKQDNTAKQIIKTKRKIADGDTDRPHPHQHRSGQNSMRLPLFAGTIARRWAS